MDFFGCKSKYQYLFFLMCFLIPCAESCINSTISVYLTQELNFNAKQLSQYFMLYPISYIVIVMLIGKLSDTNIKRSRIIATVAVFGIISSYIFYSRPSALILFLVLIPVYAISQTTFSQIFASAREFASDHVSKPIFYLAFLRSGGSLAWVIVPSICFYLVSINKFDCVFYLAGSLFLTIMLVSLTILPDTKHIEENQSTDIPKGYIYKNFNVLLICFCVCLAHTGFATYSYTLPLYMIEQIHLDPVYSGYALSVAALLEIPIMLLSPFLAKKIGFKRLLAFSMSCMVLYLVLLQFSTNPYEIILLSILPALYIGPFCSMGMILLQILLDKVPGQATSLFYTSLTAGLVLGGYLVGFAEKGNYTTVHILGVISYALALFFFIFTRCNANSK